MIKILAISLWGCDVYVVGSLCECVLEIGDDRHPWGLGSWVGGPCLVGVWGVVDGKLGSEKKIKLIKPEF